MTTGRSGSPAYLDWCGSRRKRLDELVAAHAAMSGTGRGRRWRTQQVNWSMILRLAGEFQGYARDLHDVTVDEFATRMGSTQAAESAIRLMATSNRQLDRANAQPKSLADDFAMFGLQLWPELERYSSKARQWNEHLDVLNRARNGIAHDSRRKIKSVEAEGFPLSQLKTFRRFRASLEGLIGALDDVVADHCANIFQSPRPW